MDAELIARSRAGDDEAFARLVRAHAGLVGSIALNILGDADLAGDVAQETFLKVHRHLGDLEEPEKFKSWLCGVARTTSIDALRRGQGRPVSLEALREEGKEPPIAAPTRTQSASVEQEELFEKVLATIRSFPRIYQEPIYLHHLRHMTYQEISAFLSVPVATVESRLYRARLMLRERLRPYYDGVTE